MNKYWAFSSAGQSAALTRQMSGVRISQRPLLRSPRLLTGVFVFLQVCQKFLILSKYAICNQDQDKYFRTNLNFNSLTQRKQGGIPRLIGGQVSVYNTLTHSALIFSKRTFLWTLIRLRKNIYYLITQLSIILSMIIHNNKNK